MSAGNVSALYVLPDQTTCFQDSGDRPEPPFYVRKVYPPSRHRNGSSQPHDDLRLEEPACDNMVRLALIPAGRSGDPAGIVVFLDCGHVPIA